MEYLNNQKATLKKVIESLACVYEVCFMHLDGDTIRRCVDMDYTGDGKEVLIVDYMPECYAMQNYILNWEYIRPDEAKNLMEV